MARKLYIAELEFQLHIQDASIWTTEFQEKLIESIQTAFEDINIPPNLESGFIDYLEWDFGTLNSINEIPQKIQSYLTESWYQFTTPDTKTAQTVIHQTTAGVPQFPSETEGLDWITHHSQPQGPQSFFSFPAQNRASMNIPIAFFTQIWKQYVQSQSHIGLGNTMEMLRFLGLSTTLQNRFKSWFIVQPATQQQQFLKTTFMSMSNSQYENFQYDDWLAFIFQTSFNNDIFSILRLPQKMPIKTDLLRWLAIQKSRTAIRPQTSTNPPYFEQTNTTTQNRDVDLQRKQKTTPSTQNRNANSTQEENLTDEIITTDAPLPSAENEAFWLQHISFEWSNLQAAAVLPLSAHLELLTVWEKTLKSWNTPKTNPFILWFFRQRESFSQPGAFRKIILEILKWARNSPSESTQLPAQEVLFQHLRPQLPKAIILSWEAHRTAGKPQTTLPEFWSQFTPFLNNIALKNADANRHLNQEHPLFAFTHTSKLETLLNANFDSYLNPATRKIWQELQGIYEYILNQYENSETTAAYIHLFLVPNIRTLIETWLQLIQLSEQDRYLSDPINNSVNQTPENSIDLYADTAVAKQQTRADDALENQRNLETDKLEVGPNNDSADEIENQRNLETDKLEVEAALAERLKWQSQEQLESFQIFQDISPNTDDWNKNALEAWIEWQKSILAETESEQNQPQNLHQRINEFINLWKSTQALGRDRIPTEIGAIQEHHSFSFFLSHIHYQIGTLSQLVHVTLSQHPYVDIAAFENTTKELNKIQNQISELQQLQIKNFVSDARSKVWNLELTLLLNQAFVWLYAFESPQLFLRLTNEIITAWNYIYAQIKSQQTAPQSESNIPINESNFPINESNIPINESNFPINESNFPINESNFPINESNIPINESNIPINESNFPINKSNIPINESNFPINGIIPIDPLPLPIRDVFNSDNEIFDPFTSPNHIFQGVELDWRSIDDLFESFEIHLLTVLPSAPKMPSSKWLRWTESVHPVTLTHWYRIEYIKRILADSKKDATADPITQLAIYSRFIETLLDTPNHIFIAPSKVAVDVVEDWRSYLAQLSQLRNNLWNTKITLDRDREWLQLQGETARIRLIENTVEFNQSKTSGSNGSLKTITDSKESNIDANSTENRASENPQIPLNNSNPTVSYLIESQSFYSRKVGINPQQEDRILPFEVQKIAYGDAIKSIYFWLPLLGFETPYIIPEAANSVILLSDNEQSENEALIPFSETLRNTLEQLRRDPQKHLWYAELRKQKGKVYYQLAEAMSIAEVVQWTNTSYSYQWSFSENNAEKLQQFIRQEFGISAAFKLTHYIKYRLLLINKPQTRLDMALLLIEEISIRSGGLALMQAQRLLTLLKGILKLENAEFSRLQNYYNETLIQQSPNLSVSQDSKNESILTWTDIKQPPQLGAWFQEFLFERPFISKEALRQQLELWADESFPNTSISSKRSHVEVWLNQELTRAAQIFRNTIEQKAPLNDPRIQWLIEHVVVYLTHQKTLPIFEEIRAKSQLSWSEITQRLQPQIRHSIAQKVPRIHPVLQQFAQDTLLQIEKQAAPNSMQPIADKAVDVVPLIPPLKPWLNPFTRDSIWFSIKKITSPNTFNATNKPQRYNNPILRTVETLSAAFRETEMEQDLQQLLLELVAWILPLEFQDNSYAAQAPLTGAIMDKIRESIARADLDNTMIPLWLQRALTEPQIWTSQWRRHFFDILEDLNQRNWNNTSETDVASIKNQRLSEAYRRFIWELNSPIYNEAPHLGPYWLLSLHQIFDLTINLPQTEVIPNRVSTAEDDSLPNSEVLRRTTAEIDVNRDTVQPDVEKSLVSGAASTRVLAEKTQRELERLRMTRHAFWDINEAVLNSLWGSFRTAVLRQWSEELKNALPSETHNINLWLEKWVIPVKGDLTEWILNHSLSPLLRWSKMAGWSANSSFTGIQRMLLLLSNPPEMPLYLAQVPSNALEGDYEGNMPIESIQQHLNQIESSRVQAVEQLIALTWQREGLHEIAIDTLLSAKGVGIFENPINAGLKLETSPKEQKANNQVKREIDKGVRFKTQFCGLMMIAPYYATLFKRLQLMEGQQFLSESHQITAYQVLLYITEMDAEILPTEVQDLIPRIITGIAPESELFLEKPLTEETKTEAKRFLTAIKMQWPLMANVSLRGFIESFLLRGGLAWKADDGSWNIEVEGMGSDIIMQTIPWGYATMKFPWTSYLVYTIWKAP